MILEYVGLWIRISRRLQMGPFQTMIQRPLASITVDQLQLGMTFMNQLPLLFTVNR